jgi:hypothetical protein
MISTADSYAFVSDLFQVTETLERFGLRFIPRHILPAKLFRQQIEMKLQLFVYVGVNWPAVHTLK